MVVKEGIINEFVMNTSLRVWEMMSPTSVESIMRENMPIDCLATLNWSRTLAMEQYKMEK